MRKLSVLALTVVGVLALGGVANAAVRSIRTFTVSQTSTKAGASTGIKMGLITNTSPAGLTPDIGGHDDIFLHKGMVYNGAFYPACNKARLQATGQPSVCASSRIGTGSVIGLLHSCNTNPPLAQAAPVNIQLNIFNGTGGRHQYALLSGPVVGHPVLDISISKASSPYGLRETFDVIPSLISPAPGVCASLADVRFNISKKTVTVKRRIRGRTVTTHPGLLVNGPCPKNRKWFYRDHVAFVSAPGVRTTSFNGDRTLTCKP